ncbi:retinol dehydrogenase 12 isoform X2 [Venturia canescens]|uniref:retinol dehydrogenase 12 isoform X2 n=1 Tax=Venturia canescens TaxID=32260 RepID=UPI001C9BE39B|nr:retinol dehydrogenase 12 isoform X2 [Venturia canescens]
MTSYDFFHVLLLVIIVILLMVPKIWKFCFSRGSMRYQKLVIREIARDMKYANSNRTDLPKKTGCVAVITGGSRGIGVEVVRMLMKCDMDIVLACRNTAAGEKVVKNIRESGVMDGKAKVYELDNSSLESVRKFSEMMKNEYKKIDILINNAGVMFPPYVETKDGFEQQWGVNYLSHFLLTALLVPLLRNAGNEETRARIINVSSCAHLLGTINFEDINYKKRFITSAAYAQSKLASVMFTTTLQRHLQERNLPIQTFAVHPGIVNTDLFENTIFSKVKIFTRLFFKSPEKGATTTVYAAVSPRIEHEGGIYLSNCRSSSINRLAKDENACNRLFELSLQQVKLKDFFQNL